MGSATGQPEMAGADPVSSVDFFPAVHKVKTLTSTSTPRTEIPASSIQTRTKRGRWMKTMWKTPQTRIMAVEEIGTTMMGVVTPAVVIGDRCAKECRLGRDERKCAKKDRP